MRRDYGQRLDGFDVVADRLFDIPQIDRALGVEPELGGDPGGTIPNSVLVVIPRGAHENARVRVSGWEGLVWRSSVWI